MEEDLQYDLKRRDDHKPFELKSHMKYHECVLTDNGILMTDFQTQPTSLCEYQQQYDSVE